MEVLATTAAMLARRQSFDRIGRKNLPAHVSPYRFSTDEAQKDQPDEWIGREPYEFDMFVHRRVD